MKSRAINACMIVGLSVVLSSPLAFSQPGTGRRSGGMGRGNATRMYDPATVQTLTGEVTSVDTIAGRGWMAGGVHVVVKSDTVSMDVHLGPAWYLGTQEVKVRKGDHITVTGSRIIFEGKPALVASGLEKGDSTLKLRDKNGYPLWAQRRK